MDVYPTDFVARYDPLCVLSGLDPGDSDGSEQDTLRQGMKVGPTSARITGQDAATIVRAFQTCEASNPTNFNATAGQGRPIAFNVAPRQYAFPARKASPQAQNSESRPDSAPPATQSPNTALYSPLSPLATGSPLYPDGLMTPLWISKYRSHVPCIFISFFELSADPNIDSLRDNQIKNDIVAISQALQNSKFRTRHAVILVGNEGLHQANAQLEDRLNTIRRGTRLEESMLHFLSSGRSIDEIGKFAAAVISVMRAQMVEFYREATRHARRKRDKGGGQSVQRNTGPGLSRMAWIARYEYKLGVFAEFRGEMDVAERHYVAALNGLFDHQGPFEATSSWSPRWDEARTWADTTSIRLVRCQLSVNAPTLAVRSWVLQRNRIRSMLSRNGKGIQNYGWYAWIARWSGIMANLIDEQSATLDGPRGTEENDEAPTVPLRAFAVPERFVSQEQAIIPAWDHMHHPGYWWMLSASYSRKRRDLASQIPDEDRVAPGQSPASTVARRSEAYDTFTCLESHREYDESQQANGIQTADIICALSRAVTVFTDREQPRSADRARIVLATEWKSAGKAADGMTLLRAVLGETYWRSERWFKLLQKLCNTAEECAVASESTSDRLRAAWEKSSLNAPQNRIIDNGSSKETTASTPQNHLTSEDPRSVQIKGDDTISQLELSFGFTESEGNVGEPLSSQLQLRNISGGKTPKSLTLTQLQIEFNGGIETTMIEHSSETPFDFENDHVAWQTVRDVDITRSSNEETAAKHSAKANLTISSFRPSVIELTLYPTSAGEVFAARAVAYFTFEKETIELSTPLINRPEAPILWLKPCQRYDAKELFCPRQQILQDWPSTVLIQPRPPKLDVTVLGLPRVVYSDENVLARVKVLNKEESQAESIQILAQAMEDNESRPIIEWNSPDNKTKIETDADTRDMPTRGILPLRQVPNDLEPGAYWEEGFTIQSDLEQTDMTLAIEARYSLEGQSDNIMSKSISVDFAVICAFIVDQKVKSDFHPADWTSYFALGKGDEKPDGEEKGFESSSPGLGSRWYSEINIKSAALEVLEVQQIKLLLLSNSPNASCKMLQDRWEYDESHSIHPESEMNLTSRFDIIKRSLDDRRPVSLEPAVEIRWRRASAPMDSSINVSTLPLQPLSLAGNEPRVLVRQLQVEEEAIVIELVMENPSLHFLTLEAALDSDDDFAYSGPKTRSTNLLPVSRRSTKYVIVPLRQVDALRLPLRVIDLYFNKTLMINAVEPLRSEANLISVPLPKRATRS